MFEHVGKPFYTTYFKKIYEMLEQDGIAVIHTIGNIRSLKLLQLLLESIFSLVDIFLHSQK